MSVLPGIAKGQAMGFTIDSSVRIVSAQGDVTSHRSTSDPPVSSSSSDVKEPKGKGRRRTEEEAGEASVITVLAVACKRRVVLFTWIDGEYQDLKV